MLLTFSNLSSSSHLALRPIVAYLLEVLEILHWSLCVKLLISQLKAAPHSIMKRTCCIGLLAVLLYYVVKPYTDRNRGHTLLQTQATYNYYSFIWHILGEFISGFPSHAPFRLSRVGHGNSLCSNAQKSVGLVSYRRFNWTTYGLYTRRGFTGQATGRSRAWVWRHVSTESEPITGVWAELSSGSRDRAPGLHRPWIWTPFCIITPWGAGKLVPKSVFVKQKYLSDIYGRVANTLNWKYGTPFLTLPFPSLRNGTLKSN